MKRPSVRIALLALAAACLIGFLAYHAGLTWTTLVRSVKATSGWALFLFLILTAISIALSALKWLITLRDLAPQTDLQPKLAEATLTTALGELVGQIMPVQASVTLVRSFASRLGVGWTLRGNLGSTVFEQLFDLMVVGVAAVAGLLGLALRLGPPGWMFLIILSIVPVIGLSMRLPALLATHALWLSRVLPKHGRAQEFLVAASSFNLSPRTLIKLITLSLLRYASNVARVVILLGALGMWAQAFHAAAGFPLVQIITALPITPGNLGVVEWTWSALLVSSGATMVGAALFAITARMANIGSIAILVVFLCGYLTLQSALTCDWRRKWFIR